ncbi:uncharacterized protein LOC111408641 [Olea europaea var. sylvestris]|uniref:uncharacterized protein LOC111408641 n=1 Tax=Olea europaea var. sylvestris TaxID=158386 RepID=UPI000C1CD595|nr:uncharacterized protein LOC111408641 [Olea europaea var. sylvestris]
MFSQGGREILLKSVALAIPSYAMSCLKLSSTLCTEIERMMSRFWWDQRKEERKIHWQSWNTMCTLKSMGARYFPKVNILKASIRSNPSYAWCGIWKAKNLLIQGRRWVVGDGHTIHILNDNWIPGVKNLSRDLVNDLQHHNQQLESPVASLIDLNLKWWNLTKLRALFNPKIVEAILKLHPSPLGEKDFWLWEHEKIGLYFVSSAYRFFKNCLTPDRGNSSNTTKKKKWDTIWRL